MSVIPITSKSTVTLIKSSNYSTRVVFMNFYVVVTHMGRAEQSTSIIEKHYDLKAILTRQHIQVLIAYND